MLKYILWVLFFSTKDFMVSELLSSDIDKTKGRESLRVRCPNLGGSGGERF